MTGGAFVHLVLNTDDPKSAGAFYQALFGWSMEETPGRVGGTYIRVQAGDGPGAAISGKPVPEAPTVWLPYVGVSDIGATVRRVTGLGAEVMTSVTPIPGIGSFAVLRDPTGAAVGVFQPTST